MLLEHDRGEVVENVARSRVVRVRRAAQVVHDAPDGVERRLHGPFRPARRPRDVVAGQEEPAVVRRQVPLHEVGEEPALVP